MSRPRLKEGLRVVEPRGFECDVGPFREDHRDPIAIGRLQCFQDGLRLRQSSLGLGPIFPLMRGPGEHRVGSRLAPRRPAPSPSPGASAAPRGNRLPSAGRSRRIGQPSEVTERPGDVGVVGLEGPSRGWPGLASGIVRPADRAARTSIPPSARRHGRPRVPRGIPIRLSGVDDAQGIEHVGRLLAVRPERLFLDGQRPHQSRLCRIVLLDETFAKRPGCGASWRPPESPCLASRRWPVPAGASARPCRRLSFPDHAGHIARLTRVLATSKWSGPWFASRIASSRGGAAARRRRIASGSCSRRRAPPAAGPATGGPAPSFSAATTARSSRDSSAASASRSSTLIAFSGFLSHPPRISPGPPRPYHRGQQPDRGQAHHDVPPWRGDRSFHS